MKQTYSSVWGAPPFVCSQYTQREGLPRMQCLPTNKLSSSIIRIKMKSMILNHLDDVMELRLCIGK